MSAKCRKSFVFDFKSFFLKKYPYFFTATIDGHFVFLSPEFEKNGFTQRDKVNSKFVLVEGSLEIEMTKEQMQARRGKLINLKALKENLEIFGELDFDPASQHYVFAGYKEKFLSHSVFRKTTLELMQLAIFPLENPNPLLRIDHEGNLCFSNAPGAKLWDFLLNDLQQKSDIIHQAITTLDDRLNDSIQLTIDHRIYDAVFVPDPGQNFVGIYFTDITQRVENEKALETQKSKLVSASRLSALGEMASGIAHEINNPMAVIMARAKLLQKMVTTNKLEAEKLKAYSQQIEKMGERITKIINALRSFARDGEQDPMETLSLKSCVENVLSLCEERFNAMKISLKIDEIPHLEIRGRAVQLEQVLVNLIVNATQAIQNDSEKWVQISFQNRKSHILIHVIDSGAGISEAIEKKLMQPFFTTKAVGSGTGLGLSISLGIIQDHGGKLYLNRNYANTCFTIELPLRLTGTKSDDKIAS